jgi:uncharacterized protein YbcI
MSETHANGATLATVSNALRKPHKEQLGRGLTSARTHFVGPDAMHCVFTEALLPAERRLVDMGEQKYARESRLFLQVATSTELTDAVEQIVSRKVATFASASDPDKGVVFEVFSFEPLHAEGSGGGRPTDT